MIKKSKRSKIVTIGGGTGSFTVLSGIKELDAEVTAIVNMVDDGGSTGILRDDYGVLPPGDVRQCLVALSRSSELMRELFNYRFGEGDFRGHNFGNLFISALEKITGSFEEAITEASDVLAIKGRVVPVTIANTRLCLKTQGGKTIVGQYKIENSFFEKHKNFQKLYLKPKAKINPKAKNAILSADIVILGPGSFYTSLVPNLLVKGMSNALIKTKAKRVFISNLINKPGQTDKFSVYDYIKTIEKYIGQKVFDYIIYNNKKPDKYLLSQYEEEGENLVWFKRDKLTEYALLGGDLLSKNPPKKAKNDQLKRSLIRHDSSKVANLIKEIYEKQA